MATRQQIDSFHEFASREIDNGGAELSIDELFHLWRARNPTEAELAHSVAAVKAAGRDLESGDAGRPARQALRETCDRLGLVIDESDASDSASTRSVEPSATTRNSSPTLPSNRTLGPPPGPGHSTATRSSRRAGRHLSARR